MARRKRKNKQKTNKGAACATDAEVVANTIADEVSKDKDPDAPDEMGDKKDRKRREKAFKKFIKTKGKKDKKAK